MHCLAQIHFHFLGAPRPPWQLVSVKCKVKTAFGRGACSIFSTTRFRHVHPNSSDHTVYFRCAPRKEFSQIDPEELPSRLYACTFGFHVLVAVKMCKHVKNGCKVNIAYTLQPAGSEVVIYLIFSRLQQEQEEGDSINHNFTDRQRHCRTGLDDHAQGQLLLTMQWPELTPDCVMSLTSAP